MSGGTDETRPCQAVGKQSPADMGVDCQCGGEPKEADGQAGQGCVLHTDANSMVLGSTGHPPFCSVPPGPTTDYAHHHQAYTARTSGSSSDLALALHFMCPLLKAFLSH